MSNEKEINSFLYRPILSGKKYDEFMPFSDCSSVLLGSGDTGFALSNMKQTALKYKHHTADLSQKFFSIQSIEKLTKDIHQFLFHHIQYKLDGTEQKLRSPACSWASRAVGIDCKSYSIFASTILQNVGVGHYFRRIVQASNPGGYSHVYVVVPKNQNTMKVSDGYWVIDATIPTMQEIPFLQKDDLLVFSPKKSAGLSGLIPMKFAGQSPMLHQRQTGLSGLDNKFVSRSLSAHHIKNEKQKAYENFLVFIENFKRMFPNNTDLISFEQKLTNLYETGQELRLEVDGFSFIVNGERFDLVPPTALGNAEISPDMIDELINQNYNAAKQGEFVAGMQKKQDVMNKVNLVTNAAASAGDAAVGVMVAADVASKSVPVVAAVAACIQMVGVLVQVCIMFFYDPCSGAFYTADYINKRLKEDFHEQFKSTMNRVLKHMKNETPLLAVDDLNDLLREIDLGYEHYMHQKELGDPNVCSRAAFLGYETFAVNIKNIVNAMFDGLEAAMSEGFNFITLKKEASTSQRAWYFIVPASRNPKMSQYRKINIESRDKKKGIYPYGSEEDFEHWLEGVVYGLELEYGKATAQKYKSEMLSHNFEAKIKQIREDIYLPVVVQVVQEDELRKEQYEIYLKYDTNYKKELFEKAQSKKEAHRIATLTFWEELKKIRKIRIQDEKTKLENVKIVAQRNANRMAKLEDKATKNLAITALIAGVFLWKLSE